MYFSNMDSAKRLYNYGQSPCYSWRNLTISMAIFNSYVKRPEGTSWTMNDYDGF